VAVKYVYHIIKSRRMRWAWNAVGMGGEERCTQGFVGKPEGKRPLGRPRSRWEDNIKRDLQEVGCGTWKGSIWLRIGTGGQHLLMR
jgi:hypothetical protein